MWRVILNDVVYGAGVLSLSILFVVAMVVLSAAFALKLNDRYSKKESV